MFSFLCLQVTPIYALLLFVNLVRYRSISARSCYYFSLQNYLNTREYLHWPTTIDNNLQLPTPSQNFSRILSLQKARFMNQPHDTGAFTTVSGMIGGVVKAISVKPVMMAITFDSLANVSVYATESCLN